MSASPVNDSAVAELRDVSFRWPGSETPLLEIDAFRLEASERVFLNGPSGCGKSTLLGLFGGVLKPQAGHVEVLGQDLSGLKARDVDSFRTDHIGFVFQLFNLVPYLNTVDNVTLPCRFSTRRRQRAETRSGTVHAEAERLLDALELNAAARGTRDVSRLSIGQQQRVAVARALMGAPDLIIADEPTSALDEGTRERFLELLFDECANSGTGVLLVSHDARLGPLFDRQVAMQSLNSAAP